MFSYKEYKAIYDKLFEDRVYTCKMERSSIALLDEIHVMNQGEIVLHEEPVYQQVSPVMGQFLGQTFNRDILLNHTYSDTRMSLDDMAMGVSNPIESITLTISDLATIFSLGGRGGLVDGSQCVEIVRVIETYQRQCEYRRRMEPHYIMPEQADMDAFDGLKRAMMEWTKFYVPPKALHVGTIARLFNRGSVKSAAVAFIEEKNLPAELAGQVEVAIDGASSPPQRPLLGLDIGRRRPLKKDPYDLR